MRLVGYSDVLSAQPGETVRFMVSSEVDRYRADIVRLIHGDRNPAGPGFKSVQVESNIGGEYDGRPQRIRSGSYVRVPHDARLDARGSFEIDLWIWATTPDDAKQALVSKHGRFELALENGRLTVRVGTAAARLERAVEPRTWYRVSAAYDSERGEARLSLEPLETTARHLADSATLPLAGEPLDVDGADLLVGATEGDDGPTGFFNGKLEAPRITTSEGLLAHWDFSADISTRRVRDVSGNGLDGRAVNMPTRGVTAHNWDTTEFTWHRAPEQYGAIYFHEDDLDDADWEVDFSWAVPDDTASGVYAVHLRAGDAEDHIPFFVRPRRGQPTAKILFLAPVFSYLAYGNEHLTPHLFGDTPEKRRSSFTAADHGPGRAILDYPSSQERYRIENRLLSQYDRHRDHSGVCYSSWLRPIVNMRPDAVMSFMRLGSGAPHQLSADLHLVDWLHEQGYPFDVVTDADLHREGAELLEPYDVVLTGTHCEYWSAEMLDATTEHVESGGRLMYLGGNGLYWVSSLDPGEGHTVEIRRIPPGPFEWHTGPGEGHLSTTGEHGGLWRQRGRAPQRLAGVGFAGGDIVGPGKAYERQSGSHDPRVAFIFEGIADDELIGDFPCLTNDFGAVGYEWDRADRVLGSPHSTIVLASACFPGYGSVPDEVLDAHLRFDEASPVSRADMVYIEYPSGGAVFSTSSVAWCGCLSYNDYDNNVSRITRNVLDRFSPSS